MWYFKCSVMNILCFQVKAQLTSCISQIFALLEKKVKERKFEDQLKQTKFYECSLGLHSIRHLVWTQRKPKCKESRQVKFRSIKITVWKEHLIENNKIKRMCLRLKLNQTDKIGGICSLYILDCRVSQVGDGLPCAKLHNSWLRNNVCSHLSKEHHIIHPSII